MKFLLAAINAKYIHSNLAVYSLKSYAREYEEDIEIGEYTINQPLDDILKDIYLRRPDIIGFSCYIWNIDYVKELLPEIHKLLPDTKLWLGGPEVSFDAKLLLEEFPQLTGIMLGEGEKTFLQLIQYYKGCSIALDEIKGLVYREKQKILETSGMPDIMDMNTIPFCYKNLKDFEHKIIYYESSRGCPFSCSYCLSSIDKSVRFRDLELVKQELDFFLLNKVPQVKFIDRTFNCNHMHSISIWKHILEHDNGVTNFHFEISADLLNEEELQLMKQMRPGLIQLEIGVQSTNPHTIREIRRTMDFDKLKANVSRIKEYGNIHMHLDLIAGLPFEDYQSFADSFSQVYALKPDQLQLGFLKVLKGSYMHQYAKDYGIVYKSSPPYEVLYTKWISYDDILALKGIEEMVELYYNSGQYTTTMEELDQYFETSFHTFRRTQVSGTFYMYECLSNYFEKKHLFDRKLNRLEKYQVLFDFINRYVPGKIETFRNLLVYDLYLRENVKSRPAFALDQSPYKSRIKSFFIKEESERKYLLGYDGYNSRQMSHMAHIEVFPSGDSVDYILFDYKNKDALTGNAKTTRILEGLWTEYKRY